MNLFFVLAIICFVAGATVNNLSYVWVLIGSGLVFMTIGLFQFKGRRRKSDPS